MNKTISASEAFFAYVSSAKQLRDIYAPFDIYTLVPKIETHRSEITTLAKEALRDPDHVSNPITVFFPQFWD